MLLIFAGLSFSDCEFGLGRSTLRWGVRGRSEQLFSIPDFYSQGWTRINYQLFVCRSKIGRKCRVAFVIEPSDSLHYNFLWIGGVRGRSEQLLVFPSFTSLATILRWATVRSQSDHSPITVRSTVRSQSDHMFQQQLQLFIGKKIFFFKSLICFRVVKPKCY